MTEQDLLLVSPACVVINESAKKEKKERKIWVRPSLQKRQKINGIVLMNELKCVDLVSAGRHLQNFARLSSSNIEYLLQRIDPIIKKADTNYRSAISSLERLLVTLRFLATGDSYNSLMYLFKISKQTISTIIPETCDAIAEVLKDNVMVSNVYYKIKILLYFVNCNLFLTHIHTYVCTYLSTFYIIVTKYRRDW